MKTTLVLVIAVLALSSAPCLASVMESEASVTLTITGIHTADGSSPDYLSLSAFTQLVTDEQNTSGDAAIDASYLTVVNALDPENLQVGDSITLSSVLSGSLTTGALSADLRTIALLQALNVSGSVDVWIDLTFTRTWNLSTTDTGSSDGAGAALVANTISEELFNEVRELSTGASSESDSFTYSWLVSAESVFDQIDVSTQAYGSIESAAAVPEPSSLMLVGGLVGMCLGSGQLRRWRQK